MLHTAFEQIVNVSQIGKRVPFDKEAIIAMAEKEELVNHGNDSVNRLFLLIDGQNDFITGGPMGVNGSICDVERITRFIYNNIAHISNVMCTQDWHSKEQIFHECWWEDSNGKNPAPYTVITYKDVMVGKWRPVIGDAIKSFKYLKELEKAGNKNLCVWPYHCLANTEGAALENEFAKMLRFYSVVRMRAPFIVKKGTDPYSEMYGAIKPEYSEIGYVNTEVLDILEQYDEIYAAGEAFDYCVGDSLIQCVEERSELAKKIILLEDCTSAIGSREEMTNKLKKLGIRFAKSTDIKFDT